MLTITFLFSCSQEQEVEQTGLMGFAVKWGFVDTTGQLVIGLNYDDVRSFNADGRAIVKKQGHWGVINRAEKILLDFEFDMLQEVENSNAYIYKQGNKFGFVNVAEGVKDTVNVYDEVQALRDSFFLVKKLGSWFVINRNSNAQVVDSYKFDHTVVYDGGTWLGQKGIKSYLFKDNNLIDSTMNDVAVYSGGFFSYRDKGLLKLKHQRKVYNVDSALQIGQVDHSVVSTVKSDTWNMYDYKRNKYLKKGLQDVLFVEPNYWVILDSLGQFSLYDSRVNKVKLKDFESLSITEDVGLIKRAGGYFYCNSVTFEALSKGYDFAWPFEGGYARVQQKDGSLSIINRSFEVVYTSSFKEMKNLKYGLVAVKQVINVTE